MPSALKSLEAQFAAHRKVYVCVALLLCLQIASILFLGTSHAGSFFTNTLEVFTAWLAAGMCFSAYRRASGVARPFWLMTGFGALLWGLANIGWMYYDVWLQVRVPSPSPSRFFFELDLGFYTAALFLDEERDSSRLDQETLLDFAQIAIVLLFLYFGVYYLPALKLDAATGLRRELTHGLTVNFLVLSVGIVRYWQANSPQLHRLYRGTLIFLALYAVCGSTADYMLSLGGVSTGTWWDFGWTAPFLAATLMIANWQPSTSPAVERVPRKTFGGLLVNNMALVVAPIAVMIVALSISQQYPWLGYLTVILSAGCFAARFSLHQHRQLLSNAARAAAETKFRTLVEHLSAVTYVAEVGLDTPWTYVSPQIELLTGFSPAEWLADSGQWLHRVHADDQPTVIAAERASLKRGRYQSEYRFLRKDGRAVWVSDTAVILRDPGGTPLLHGVLVDITDNKLMELQLRQAGKMEAVGTLAGGIAHDFNNLLTVIEGYAELLVNQAENNAPMRDGIKKIQDATKRAAGLTRQLLAFSRRQVLQPRVIDLNNVAFQMDAMLRRMIGEDIQMRTITDPKLRRVLADPAQIEQVIMNLVVNARDAMPHGGKLTLETSNVELDQTIAQNHSAEPGHYVMLAVTDSGVGMDAETQSHIFEPFFSTKPMGRGTGLGLSTVYGIVKQSGGHIWVYSEVGSGTCFKIFLPPAHDQPEHVAEQKRPEAWRRGDQTILLVEDEDSVRELTRTILASCGYSVLAAGGAAPALGLAAKHGGPIHLLLTDVVMPECNGHELAQRLLAIRPDTRVLYMSGYTDNVIAHHGKLEQDTHFLQKPFTPAALAEKVHQVLNSLRP
jgi:PAS domain S-box-containing protein